MTTNIFQYGGEAQFSGKWSTITTARAFNACLLNVPTAATHWMRYTTGATAALTLNEILTGGTSTKTCRLVAQATEDGTILGGDQTGIILVNQLSGTFTAAGEILTGAISTGVVTIIQGFLPIRSFGMPKALFFTVEAASITYSIDGTTPTATGSTNLGHQLANGGSEVIRGWQNIQNFKAINTTDANGARMKYTLFY